MKADETMIMTNNATSPTGRHAWLGALMLREPGRWSKRLGLLLNWLQMLGRGRRRRFGRAAAGTLAGASGIALMALLAGPMTPPAAAATGGAIITVNNTTCTLVDAIKAANTNAAVGGCVAGSGSGADTIKLTANVVLNSSEVYLYSANTALPKIVSGSDIIVDGQGKTISRGGTGYMRFFATAWNSNLTLSNVTIYGGNISDNNSAYGGAIYNRGGLVVTNATFSNNRAGGSGGAIFADGRTTITGTTFIVNSAGDKGGAVYVSEVTASFYDVTFSSNSASSGGAVASYEMSDVTISKSTMSGNSASGLGGAIHIQEGTELTISDTAIDMNTAEGNGGAVWIDGDFSITGSNFYGNSSSVSWGGALYSASDSATGTISDTAFISNTATLVAGAVYFADGTLTIDKTLFSGNQSGSRAGALNVAYGTATITNSIFENNVSPNNGGAIYVDEADMVIIGSQFTGNTATFTGGAIYTYYGSTLKVYDSEFSGNRSLNDDGGAIYTYSSENKIVNSTFSGNSASDYGGAIVTGEYGMEIVNSTFVSNTADYGGAIYNNASYLVTIHNSIISGNRATSGGNELRAHYNTYVYGGVLGDSGETNSDAFSASLGSISFYDSPYYATSDGSVTGGVALSDIVKPTLASNGGPRVLPGNKATRSHNLPEGSPAIDIVNGATCDPATDQRGFARPYGDGCDAGAIEYYPSAASVFVVAGKTGAITEGPSFNPADILEWDGESWTKWFDSAAAGLKPINSTKPNIRAMWIADTENADVVMAFAQNAQKVPGISGRVDGMDLVRWNGSAFSPWFDGSDVGLNIKAQEKIDALHVLDSAPGPIGRNGRNGCEAYLLISTLGPGSVRSGGPGSPTLRFRGEDLLGFCAVNLGENTAGSWEILVDGSEEGLSANNLDGVSANEDGTTLYLTTKRAMNVDGVTGGHSTVFVFDMASRTFSGPVFVAADNGLNQIMTGVHVEGELSLP